jgi:hypothetical protein
MSGNLVPEHQQRSGAIASSAVQRARMTPAAVVVGLCWTDSITGQTLLIDAGRVPLLAMRD